MDWQRAGKDAEAFRAAAQQNPGWYWVYRPLNIGGRAFDPSKGIRLPVIVHADGQVDSPLADFAHLDQAVCEDDDSNVVYDTWFSGPVAPGARTGALSKQPGQPAQGAAPAAPGWYWCRTQAPLKHVDGEGIGPIYLENNDGTVWVYPAATTGAAMDVFELGFAEPLVSDGGVIDASGAVQRHQAEFFGAIAEPSALPDGFPTI